MTEYDPNETFHRIALATHIRATAMGLRFVPTERPGTKEVVMARESTRLPHVSMLLFTSIEGNEVREIGADSIKVCAVYTSPRDGQVRGLIKEARVHRTGMIEEIPLRIKSRIVEAASALNDVKLCPDCGAPIFINGKGKPRCAEYCWSRGKP